MKKVAVVGAGMMGREIAIVYARAGHQVAIVDATMELAQVAKEKQAGILEDTIRVFLKRAAWHLAHRSRDELKTGMIVFGTKGEYLGETDDAAEILKEALSELKMQSLCEEEDHRR